MSLHTYERCAVSALFDTVGGGGAGGGQAKHFLINLFQPGFIRLLFWCRNSPSSTFGTAACSNSTCRVTFSLEEISLELAGFDIICSITPSLNLSKV